MNLSNLNESDTKEIIHIRDRFAGEAMQAIISQHRLNCCGDFIAGDGLLQHHKAPEYVAKTAYQFANAMMEERIKS